MEKASIEDRLSDIESFRDKLLGDLSSARSEVTEARRTGQRNAQKLVEIQEAHAKDSSELRLRLETQTEARRASEARIHVLDLELARAQARLEGAISQSASIEKRLNETVGERDIARAELATARADVVAARAETTEARNQAARTSEKIASIQEVHVRELAALQSRLTDLQNELRRADKSVAENEQKLVAANRRIEELEVGRGEEGKGGAQNGPLVPRERRPWSPPTR